MTDGTHRTVRALRGHSSGGPHDYSASGGAVDISLPDALDALAYTFSRPCPGARPRVSCDRCQHGRIESFRPAEPHHAFCAEYNPSPTTVIRTERIVTYCECEHGLYAFLQDRGQVGSVSTMRDLMYAATAITMRGQREHGTKTVTVQVADEIMMTARYSHELVREHCLTQWLRAPDPAPPVPTRPITGEVVGFRCWSTAPTDPLTLRPQFQQGATSVGFAWTPGTTHMKCCCYEHQDLSPQSSPHPACTCGLHAYYEPPRHTYTYVQGAVIGWGGLIAQANGWRAQHARVVCIAEGHPNSEAIARRYSAELVPPSLLVPAAREHAQEFPPELRPEAPASPFDEFHAGGRVPTPSGAHTRGGLWSSP